MSGPYDRVYWSGERLNRRTMNMLIEAERRYGGKFTYYQGSYNAGGVTQSAGTHDGGGAVDLWASRPEEAVRILRQVGFAAWIRNPSQGDWVWHIHAIAIEDAQLSSGAASQVRQYYNGTNGLASYGKDYHWRPSPIPVWGRTVGPGTDKKKKVDWFAIKRQLEARTPTHRWAVKVLQRNLKEAGYKKIIVDGVAGPQTRRFFKHYRERTNLGPFNAARKLLNPNYRPVRDK